MVSIWCLENKAAHWGEMDVSIDLQRQWDRKIDQRTWLYWLSSFTRNPAFKYALFRVNISVDIFGNLCKRK